MATLKQSALPGGPPPDLEIAVTAVGDAMVCSLAGDLHTDNEDRMRRALVDQVLGGARRWSWSSCPRPGCSPPAP
ncbi:hypothetical protein [Streptomyces sp. NRRL B-24484]|uniref:hypothetical protein n=1 Tax=Streptomyces sp. NRRL B-24484 TaxID=1463833 RepID=UPI0004C074AB|nr:hypothetical protein [Streptomyces sp. NRRL B-24484]